MSSETVTLKYMRSAIQWRLFEVTVVNLNDNNLIQEMANTHNVQN